MKRFPLKITTRLIVALFLAFFLLIFVVNNWMLKSLESPPVKFQPNIPKAPVMEINPYADKEIIRKIHLDPNRTYFESVFWANDQEIARYKNIEEKIYDVSGTIPDGKVKFENDSLNTYGEEYYRDGQRQGDYTEHYSTGQIKREAHYADGKLITNKEYFIDGKLRMEEDSRDALIMSDSKEVGTGRIYFRSGTMMYEWNITNRGPQRYAHSYNIKGQLVEEKIFDVDGKLVEVKKIVPEEPPVLEGQP